MDGRTIATHGGGDLVIGGGPPIDGVLHCWYYPEGQRGERGAFGFMLNHRQADELALSLHLGAIGEVKTFTGRVKLTVAGELLCLWFYSYGSSSPEQVIRLHESACDTAAQAIEEALSPMAPMPVDLHDASLTAPARNQLEQLLVEGLVRKAA